MGDGEKMLARKGEYVYSDDDGVICRLAIKQCNRTKITTETKDVLVILQGNEKIDSIKLKEETKKFVILVEDLLS